MNWFKYRLPYSPDFICGASRTIKKGFGKGFVIAPFYNPAEGMMTIPFDFLPDDVEIKPIDTVLPDSTTKESHAVEIDAIIASLNEKRGKTVAARALCI
ncbi:MAG: hypothetical protein K2H49_03880, partial [Muribaculaceae bacterium]|nr:hypothetical protein [Muribaculaceae bacterium]